MIPRQLWPKNRPKNKYSLHAKKDQGLPKAPKVYATLFCGVEEEEEEKKRNSKSCFMLFIGLGWITKYFKVFFSNSSEKRWSFIKIKLKWASIEHKEYLFDSYNPQRI